MSLPFLHPYIGLSSGLNTRQAATALTFQDDYTTNTGWTQTGSTITVDSGVADKVAWISTSSTGTDSVSKSLGVTLSDSTWLARFAYKKTAEGGHDDRFNLFALCAGTGHAGTASQDMVSFTHSNSYETGVYFHYKDGASGLVESGLAVSLSTNTQYYVEFSRTSTINLRLKVFTNSDYTSGQVGSTFNYTIPSTVGGFTHLQHSSAQNAYGLLFTGNIDTTRIYNGVTSI